MNALSRLSTFLFLFGCHERDGRLLLAFRSPETYLRACRAVADGWEK